MTASTLSANPFSIQARNLTVSYGASPVLWNVDVDIPSRGLTGIIGPNGAGKSTFLKAVLGMIPVTAGEVQISNQAGKQLKGDQIGYVPQRNTVDWDFPTSVFDVVMMGTYGRLRWFQRPGKNEREETWRALELVQLQDFADRQIGELSGGQQQRVFIARALVQNASVYLLDEPFAGVDAKTEKSILEILQSLRQEGCSVVMVHHDLSRAQEYFDHIVMLNGRLISSGSTKNAFTDDAVQRCYGCPYNSLVTIGS
ncbi:MAG: metal ABC transporter ATP-binding protein [Aureliella sp.]